MLAASALLLAAQAACSLVLDTNRLRPASDGGTDPDAQSGALMLEHHWQVPLGNGVGRVMVATDGTLTVAGSLLGEGVEIEGQSVVPVSSASDLFIARFEADGSLIKLVRDGADGAEFATASALDTNDQIYIGGIASGSVGLAGETYSALEGGAFSPYIASYDTELVPRWVGFFDSAVNASLTSLDYGNGVVATGRFSGSMTPQAGTGADPTPLSADTLSDAYLVRYFVDGSVARAQSFAGTVDEEGLMVVGDGAMRAYYAGVFDGQIDLQTSMPVATGASDVFISRITTFSGSINWVVHGRGDAQSQTRFIRGALAPEPALVVALDYDSSLAFARWDNLELRTDPGNPEIAVFKVAANGDLVWNLELDSTGPDGPRAVAVEPETGLVALVGEFTGELTLGELNVAASSELDGFLALISADGKPVALRAFAGPPLERVLSVAFADPDTLYVVVTYNEALDFGGGLTEPTASGNNQILIAYDLIVADGN